MSVYVNLVFSMSYFTSPFLVLLGAKNSSEWLSCTKVAPPRLADDGRAGRPGASPASAFGQGSSAWLSAPSIAQLLLLRSVDWTHAEVHFLS